MLHEVDIDRGTAEERRRQNRHKLKGPHRR
jgi:hypothetical protein